MLPISIGIPVYNEEKFLTRTIRSALQQNVKEIIISDNGSTDGTWDIITEMSSKHPRIKALRFARNEGPYANFLRCITSASQPYFMFLGGHDILSDYAALEMLATLREYDAIGSYPSPIHVTADLVPVAGLKGYPFAKELFSPSPLVRFYALCRGLTDGTPFYGLYRHKDFLEVYSRKDIVVSDLFVLGHLAIRGKLALCPKAFYLRVQNRKTESKEEVAQRYHDIARYFSQYQTRLTPAELKCLAFCRVFKELIARYPDAELHIGHFDVE